MGIILFKFNLTAGKGNQVHRVAPVVCKNRDFLSDIVVLWSNHQHSFWWVTLQFRRRWRACLLILMFILDAHAARAQSSVLLSSWRGSYLEPKQGGFYVKMALDGFSSTSVTGYVTGSVQVTLVSLISQVQYVFTHRISDIDGFPGEMWKIPSGKYRLHRLEMVDGAGHRRVFSSPDAPTFIVARLCLANFGLWTVKPSGAKDLTVSVKMVPNSYKEEGSKSESSVAAVVSGLTGIVQEVFGGKKVYMASGAGYEQAGQLRATVTTTRQVSMLYKLDLFKHNIFSRDISDVLNSYDGQIRSCYINGLAANASLKGNLVIQFLMSNQSGTMKKIRPAGGTINDPKMIQCIVLALGQISFPAKETMIGELTYTFDVM